jgi:predicted PurR-regulated permease PerM
MNPADPEKPAAERHLWEFTAVRDLLIVLLAALLTWLAYLLKEILLPIFVALLLAYLVNPLITRVRTRWGISRPVSIMTILTLFILAGAGFGIWAAPLVSKQATKLVERMPDYLRDMENRFGLDIGDLTTQLAAEEGKGEEEEEEEEAQPVVSLVGRILGTVTQIVLWVIMVPIYFAFFAWRFQHMIHEGKQYLPPKRHPRAADVLRRMDVAIGTFFRARLLICLIIGFVFAVGWWLADVPYWFLLGAITGVLSIIPYLSIVGWLLALLFKYLEMTIGPGAPGFDWMAVLLWPTLVFAIGNFLEAWILTPWIHGRTTQLRPITILTVVLIGGALGGFWGLLLAIPVAICLDILSKEFLCPRLPS